MVIVTFFMCGTVPLYGDIFQLLYDQGPPVK